MTLDTGKTDEHHGYVQRYERIGEMTLLSSMFSPLDRALALAERYVRATERIADSWERSTAAAENARRQNDQTNAGWDRVVSAVERIADVHSDETAIDTTAITEAIAGLRETLAQISTMFRAVPLASHDTKTGGTQ